MSLFVPAPYAPAGNDPAVYSVAKTTDQSIASSTTVEAISEMTIDLPAGDYVFMGLIMYSCGVAAAGVKWNWRRTGSISQQQCFSRYWSDHVVAGAHYEVSDNFLGVSSTIQAQPDASGQIKKVITSGFVRLPAANTLYLEGAQRVSNASATVFETGSFMHFTRI